MFYIHTGRRTTMGFIFWIIFLKFWIKSEKFIFKNLLKNSFLRSKKEIDKYAQRGKKENQEYANDLENNWAGTICHISDNPYNKTKPNNKEINHHPPYYHIRIKPLKNIGSEDFIHIKGL